MDDEPRTSDAEDVWAAGRAAARKQVRAVFAPRVQRCEHCGAESASTTRFCPSCHAPYAARRGRGPSRRVRWMLAGLVVVGALVGALVAGVFAPGLRSSDTAQARAQARRVAAQNAALYRVLVAEQRPHIARGPVAAPGPRAATIAARARLLAFARAQITADARVRVAAHELGGPIITTSCDPYPATTGRSAAESSPRATDLLYDCLAVQAEIRATVRNPAGELGYPFLLRVHYDSGEVAWCATTPSPGEAGIGLATRRPPLSPVCSA
jgi:hypothetical protein